MAPCILRHLRLLPHRVQLLRVPSYSPATAASHIITSYYWIFQGPTLSVPHAVHLVIALHICIIHSKMHANPLSPSGFSFHFPFKYESPSNSYWGPSAQKAVVPLLRASQKKKKKKRKKGHGPYPYEVYLLVKAGFKKKKKLNNNNTQILIYIKCSDMLSKLQWSNSRVSLSYIF